MCVFLFLCLSPGTGKNTVNGVSCHISLIKVAKSFKALVYHNDEGRGTDNFICY